MTAATLTITEPGVYDISEEAYHADPCPHPSLSASISKLLIDRSPRHAWHNHPRMNPAHALQESDTFDLGRVGHKLVLGAGAAIAPIDAKDWRTDAAKAAKKAARAAGKTPVLAHQLEQAQAMEKAVLRQLARHEEASLAFTNGKPEQTIIWREEIDVAAPGNSRPTEKVEVWCRARLDWLPHEGNVFDDFKSTGVAASAGQWGQRTFWETGCDVQAAFYVRGIKALGLAQDPHFRFIVAENEEPFALAVHTLAPASLAMAGRKVDYAMRIWARCMARDWWPGYPPFTSYLDAPPWQERRWINREEAGETDPANWTQFYPDRDRQPGTNVFGADPFIPEQVLP
jgi:hypothetical protein